MQKRLLSLAVAGVLAAPVAAFAEATVYGTIDGGIRNQSKIDFGATDESEMFVTDGVRTTNRWGIKGSEDLGGGMRANFTLEGQYASDTGDGPLGGGIFQRKSLVGLSRGGMSLDIGRDYTVNFDAQGQYEPMRYSYTGISRGTQNTGGRFSNMAKFRARFGTGGVAAQWAAGESVGDDAGDAIGFGADFTFGPVLVAGAFSSVDGATVGGIDRTTVGARYMLGAFTILGGLSNEENDTTGTKVENEMQMIGAWWAMTPALTGKVGMYMGETKSGGNKTGEYNTLVLALEYALSKSTTAYVAYDRQNQENAAGVGTLRTVLGQDIRDGGSAISAGIAHAF